MDTPTQTTDVQNVQHEHGSCDIGGTSLVVSGKWIRMAEIRDEVWLEGQAVDDPNVLLEKLKNARVKADVFSFVQKLPETRPKYAYPMEWDNVAAIPITSYEEWWEKRLPQVARKNVKRAAKRGVVARVVEYDDELVRGIVDIHNDTPTRQGRPFSHFGKDFEIVKKDYASFMDRSEFIGCYSGNELIGIIKLIYMGDTASIMQLLAKTAHYDKRPTSALMAKAVEICELRGKKYLTYGKYTYGNKKQNTLTEFKCRNGFEEIKVPRYYIPLNFKGALAVKLKLHRTLLEILPGPVINLLRSVRSAYVKLSFAPKAAVSVQAGHGEAGVDEE